MQVPSSVFLALSEILATQSPQFASRLKQRLTSVLAAKGEPPFDEKKFGFKGFRDFLKNGTQGIFSVASSEDGADVIVSLGGNNTSIAPSQKIGSIHSLRGDVWQAFTNPDASRVRYFNLRNFSIRHFLRGEDSVHAREVAENSADFVEIDFIGADVQQQWMRQFIESREISPQLRETLEGIAGRTYTSGINAAFLGALGIMGAEWRQDRLSRVVEVIHGWAERNGISIDKLTPRSNSENESALPVTPARAAGKLPSGGDVMDGVQSPREQAVRLLDILSNEEISRVVVPILLSTLLVRGKN